MKKLLFVASFVMLCLGANAQQAKGTLTYQPKFGLNIARFTDAEGTTPRFGLTAGSEFEYQITEKFSAAVGVLYSMQGARESVTTEYDRFDVKYMLDYINIPIVANVYVYKGLAVKFGVQPGLNISSKYTTSYGNSSYSISNIRTFDLAIPVGFSYETKSRIVFDARFNIGVTKVIEDLETRNCVAQLTIGYKFSL